MRATIRRYLRSVGGGLFIAATFLPLRQPGPVSRAEVAALLSVGVLGAIVVDVFLRLDEEDTC